MCVGIDYGPYPKPPLLLLAVLGRGGAAAAASNRGGGGGLTPGDATPRRASSSSSVSASRYCSRSRLTFDEGEVKDDAALELRVRATPPRRSLSQLAFDPGRLLLLHQRLDRRVRRRLHLLAKLRRDALTSGRGQRG